MRSRPSPNDDWPDTTTVARAQGRSFARKGSRALSIVDELDGIVTASKDAAIREIGVGLDPHRRIEPGMQLLAARTDALDDEYFRVGRNLDGARPVAHVPRRRPERDRRPRASQS